MRFLSVILTSVASAVHASFFRNDFLPVGHVRTDAIMSTDCLSSHVHTFYGPPLLYPKVTFQDLRISDPNLSSGNIMENQSLYWHPTVYKVAADGKKTLQESEMTTVYYNWIPGSTTAFPEGFRMITPGEEVFDEGVTSGASELEISISFQSCWDGMHLDSADHMSHVAFPLGEEEDAPCPSSHPVRIPRLDFFIRWFNTADAKWQFSDGTGTFHADYVSGWDETFLQSLLDGDDGDFDEKVTFRAGIKHQGSDSDLIQQLNDNAVPKADTSCITTEVIDNVVDLPKGTCSGTLISPVGVCGAPVSLPPSSPDTPTSSPFSSPTISDDSEPTTSPITSTLPPVSSPNPPTSSPVSSPTTTNDDDACRDDNRKFELQNGAKKTCKWVSKKNTSKRCAKKTDDDSTVSDKCPVTCQDPENPTCTSTDYVGKFEMPNGKERSCNYPLQNNGAKKEKRCGNNAIRANCPVTCEEYL